MRRAGRHAASAFRGRGCVAAALRSKDGLDIRESLGKHLHPARLCLGSVQGQAALLACESTLAAWRVRQPEEAGGFLKNFAWTIDFDRHVYLLAGNP